MSIHSYPRFIGVRLCGNESSVFLCYITELPTVCILSIFGCLKKEGLFRLFELKCFKLKLNGYDDMMCMQNCNALKEFNITYYFFSPPELFLH